MAETDNDARPAPDGRRRRPPPTIEGQAVEMPLEHEPGVPAEEPRAEPSVAATAHEVSESEHVAPTPGVEQYAEPALNEAGAGTSAAEPASPSERAATSVPGVAATPDWSSAPPPADAPEAAPARARTPWFAIFGAGLVGASLTALAAAAAWIYGAPLIEPDTSSVNARLTRLEMHTPTSAEIAAATVPDMGKVPAAKIEELTARLAKLEAAEAASARQAPAEDGAKVDELTARVSRLEAAAPGASSTAAGAAEFKELAARVAVIETAVRPLADHLTAIERENAANAKAAQEANARAETVAKAMAEARQVDAEQERSQQGTRTEVAGLVGRVGALETQVKQVGDQVAEAATPKPDATLRYALIATGLRSALERGEPFTAELSAARTAGIDAGLLDQLSPFASTGIPNVQELFRELGGLIPEMLKVSARAAQEGGYLDRLQAHAE
ncbi:MAG: hypothetical protein JO228_08655, partial [Xanthobacteraceae bacterium]|nr:hypothetical protein [Xanthobacteraceae bacterium]